jgi:hypothetical protein
LGRSDVVARADKHVLDALPGQQHRCGQSRAAAAHDQDRHVLVSS